MNDPTTPRKPGRPRKAPLDVPTGVTQEAQPLPEKKARVPFGGFTYKLEVAYKDPAYFYCWQKDTGDTLRRMEAAGYERVSRRTARAIETLSNRDVSGGNQALDDTFWVHGGTGEYGREYKLVLMRQPMEYWLEDQAAIKQAADQIDQAINRPEYAGGKVVGSNYGDINVSTKDRE